MEIHACVVCRANDMKLKHRQKTAQLLRLFILCSCMRLTVAEEDRECNQQEFRDKSGNCVACGTCGPGEELSRECGFGHGEGAWCVPCRPGRFKEDVGAQKCKPCQACAHVNRAQRINCSATSNTLCGDCLLGFYRKAKLSGFRDMQCVPCGDNPSYDPHCISRVKLVPIAPDGVSPLYMVLAGVICCALGCVLLALMLLCAIYCKRHLLQNKPNVRALKESSDQAAFQQIHIHHLPHQHSCRNHQSVAKLCGAEQLLSC